MEDDRWDVIVVGAGPAGAACAAFCAGAGLRVSILERAVFPREKVCGDCLNPDCWPVLDRLGASGRLRSLPHTDLQEVEFISVGGRRVLLPLPASARGEITVKRSALDALLLDVAVEAGAHVKFDTAVCAASRTPGGGFEVIDKGGVKRQTRFVVAADGRNSVLSRVCGLVASKSAPRRIGLQAHVPRPAGFGPRVQMHWFARGYGGVAPVGESELNVSLVGPPAAMADLKAWTRREFALAAEPEWRTMAPLDRAAVRAASEDGMFLVGDAVRVVEPFTGEGIYYALRSGELAAQFLIQAVRGSLCVRRAGAAYRAESRRLYRGRLWVNRLARLTVLHPRLASLALEVAQRQPALLGLLTAKVVRV